MKAIQPRSLLWIVFALLTQGCAIGEIMDVATEEDISKIEKSRVFPKDFDTVWAATIKSLATHGVSIQSQDKTSGNISTDWVLEKEAIEIFTTGSRYKAQFLLEKKSPSATQVTVIPTFEIRVAETANWSPATRPKKHRDAEKKILDEIQKSL
jgi:NlpB/DapX lipoprotein